MSPLTCMQVDLESWSKVELRLKVENFIKEYVSLILLLSTIFSAAVIRILSNSQLCIPSCSSHRDPNNYGLNGFLSIWKVGSCYITPPLLYNRVLYNTLCYITCTACYITCHGCYITPSYTLLYNTLLLTSVI
jgi:hypothetical protein